MNVTVGSNNKYEFCLQHWTGWEGPLPFPTVPLPYIQPEGEEWFTNDQDKAVTLFGIVAIVILSGFAFVVFGREIYEYFLQWFYSVYEPDGQSQHIDFSCNEEIYGYVPQIIIPGEPFPFLCCDVDDVDQDLIGWNDPTTSYDIHNLIFDVPWDGMNRTKTVSFNTRSSNHNSISDMLGVDLVRQESSKQLLVTRPIFSSITYYAPEWKILEKKKKGGPGSLAMKHDEAHLS